VKPKDAAPKQAKPREGKTIRQHAAPQYLLFHLSGCREHNGSFLHACSCSCGISDGMIQRLVERAIFRVGGYSKTESLESAQPQMAIAPLKGVIEQASIVLQQPH
jgi:hypothetical protein